MAKKLILLAACLISVVAFAAKDMKDPVALQSYRFFAVKSLDQERVPASDEKPAAAMTEEEADKNFELKHELADPGPDRWAP